MSIETSQVAPADFASLGLDQRILEILQKTGITVPSPIQHQAIPVALAQTDIVGIAQTGTGKTYAFGLPMLQHLASSKGRALILLPTRELAYQVEESLRPFAKAMNIGMTVFVGGASMYLQRKSLRANPRVLIATPGRLYDHLQQKTVTLKEVSHFILDEADRMFDMGFKPQIDKIITYVPDERQTLLFSATMPKEIFALAEKIMKTPLRIEVAPQGTTSANIEQELLIVEKEQKTDELIALLKTATPPLLVFTRTKHGAKKLNAVLQKNKFSSAEIHGNRSLGQRKEALQGFKSGRYTILVATDIAARGIDVQGIGTVINFDLPDDPADYVHRIGRTGRAGKTGKALSFVTPNELHDVRHIEKLIRAPLTRTYLGETKHLEAKHAKEASFNNSRPSHRRSNQRGGGSKDPFQKRGQRPFKKFRQR